MASGETYLVTGAAGFIGSHLCEALLCRGNTVVGLDNFDPFYDRALKEQNLREVSAACHHSSQWRWVEADIRELDSLQPVFAETHPDVVVHLAAKAGVRQSLENAPQYAATNVEGTINVYQASAAQGVKTFIFGSSSSVYGASPLLPWSEDQVLLQPLSPYAASKLAAETFCYTLHRLHRLPTVCLRFFTVYGPRQRPDQAIHKFVGRLEEGQSLPVYGEGPTSRDYTHVDDIVRGILAALDWEGTSDSSTHEVINLGTSAPITLSALVEELERATGREAQIEPLAHPPGEASHTCARIDKAQRLLGWQPQVDLPTGLAAFVQWYRRRFG